MAHINNLLADIFKSYDSPEGVTAVKKARQEFEELTGPLYEDAPEYEARLNSFEAWFVFNYDQKSVLHKYLKEKNVSSELANALEGINHSVFLFKKVNVFKKAIFVDVVSDTKIVVPKQEMDLGLVEGDLFLGRIFTLAGKHFLIKGVRILPKDALSPIKKQVKKLKKATGFISDKEAFLAELEKRKTKSLNYGHLQGSQIFSFDS